ncbi:tRNA (guanine(10)-N(2))-dimethyltransferase [Candidatus Woesearchaeota archaeon]|nr:tRNA (guanine(10)-N(2))-dimethyltransferase [Candidatus Woesearchaeota archaeon]
MLKKLQEGSCSFYASVGKISKELPVFYNPEMKLNRDISILLLKSIPDKDLRILDLLAGSGIRSARFIKELPASKIKEVTVNDNNQESFKLIKKNLKLNKVRAKVFNKDANELLINSEGFDYIDVDPFGSPNPFLDSAVKRLSRNGILAVTATDTSALCGSYISSCKRKYWAAPLRNYMMHETGIRILIRKVQLVAAQYDKALEPIFSHSTRHYMRVYFRCVKSKTAVDKILNNHKYLLFCNKCLEIIVHPQNKEVCCKKAMAWAGPLWTGQLWDRKLLLSMLKKLDKENPALLNLISIINAESKINVPYFFSVPLICKHLKKSCPKQESILRIGKSAQTHFALDGIRSKINIKKLKKFIQAL